MRSTRPALMGRAAAGTVGLALVATLAACGGGDTDAGVSPSPADTPISSTAPTSPAPSKTPREAPSTKDSVRPLDMTKPIDAATRIFAYWSDRDLAYQRWWTRLKPLLSPAGQQAFEYTDPANIPPLHTTGKLTIDPAGVTDVDPRLSRAVNIPTNRGRFRMSLERRHVGGPWVMLNLEFPPGVQ